MFVSVDCFAQRFESITTQAFTRVAELRDDSQHPFWINRQDCIDDDVLTFTLKVYDPPDDNFQVWVGDSDCTSREERKEDSGKCWLVYESAATASDLRIDIKARDVAARPNTGGETLVHGTLDDCYSNLQTDLTFYFMYVDGTDDVLDAPGAIKWTYTGLDLKGPPPPSDVQAGIGDDTSLIAKWTPTNSSDRIGYQVYCGAPGPAATDAVADAGSVDAGTAAPAGSADAGSGACSSPDLTPGEPPGPNARLCGETASTTASKMPATGLTDGQEAAIAVASIDDVGNPGPLSNVACGTPEPVVGFYTGYRRAGGQGGGGICSVGAPGQTPLRSSATLGLLAILGTLIPLACRRLR